MKPTLGEIKILVDQLAAKIHAPEDSLPTYGYSIDGGHPHIEIDKNGQLYYVAIERRQETYRYMAISMDDLLYQIFKGVTAMMASKFGMNNKVKGQDSRRVWFPEQERLLGILNEEWQLKKHAQFEEILKKHPFDDHASERAIYFKELMSNGQIKGNEWEIACEKYPLPK